MRPSIFLDLDNTLICSYKSSEFKKPEFAKVRPFCIHTYEEVYSVSRPKLHEFLSICNRLGKTYIFTAATLPYAKAVIRAFRIEHFFEAVYSTYQETPNSIAEKYNLTSWLHVDDLDHTTDIVGYKLNCLGINDLRKKSKKFIERYFVKINPYHPHLNEEWDELLLVAETIKEKLRKNRRVL